jgi:hypothetical protein
MSTASKVAARKEKYPEVYCPYRRCLWHTGGGYCPRHGGQKEVTHGKQSCTVPDSGVRDNGGL